MSKRFLICYDIRDKKRLAKVHRVTVKHALFVQYSIYYFEGGDAELADILDEIEMRMDTRVDDVRAYPIEPLSNAERMGQSWLPSEVILL